MSAAEPAAGEPSPKSFWTKVRRFAARAPFLRDAMAAWYCARDPDTPTRIRIILFGALAYFIAPADWIPDMIIGLGFTDDAAVLAMAIRSVAGHLRDDHYAAADRLLEAADRDAAFADAQSEETRA